MADEAVPPHTTGKPPEDISLTGRLIPAADTHTPVLLRMPGSDRLYLPCFTDENELRTFLGRAGLAYEGVKQIDDERSFLAGLPPEVTVVTNLHFTEDDKVRFHEVVPRSN